MDLNKLIKLNYDKYLSYAISIKNKNDDPYEILNETLVHLYDIPKPKLNRIGNGIDKFIYCIIWRNTYSKNSNYQRTINTFNKKRNEYYNLENVVIEENDIEDIDFDQINDILMEKCDLWEREVFLQYINIYKSFTKMANCTKIPRSALYEAYNIAIEKIIDNYEGKIKRNNRKRKSSV